MRQRSEQKRLVFDWGDEERAFLHWRQKRLSCLSGIAAAIPPRLFLRQKDFTVFSDVQSAAAIFE
jgi:hypothetical protein